MRIGMAASSLFLMTGLAFAAGEPPFGAGKGLMSHRQAPDMQLAQVCGYFAILGCFRTQAEAADWNARIESGHVINTTSDEYPNFRPGYFCVAAGPTSERRAHVIAGGWRDVIHDAYVKNSCR